MATGTGEPGDLPGELDRHLFAEGRHRHLWRLLGAHEVDRGCTFGVWAPNARSVRVLGDWCGWSAQEGGAAELQQVSSTGIWWGHAGAARVGDRYKFEIVGADGHTTLRADPLATEAERPPHTASLISRSEHRWASTGEQWRSDRSDRNGGRLSVYEAHLGSWRRHPDGRSHSARELAQPLAEWVAGLGFTHIEFMPVATHPYGGSWGYQVSGFFAPDARLGSPDDLRYLIETLHQHGVGVIIDWVPAHFPKDTFALARFDGTALYEHDDPRRGEHPDWGTLVFNHGRTEVRNFLVANALYWLEEFRVDALRVDAVASMLYLDYSREPGEWVPNRHGGREDLEAIDFVRELNEVIAEEHPGALVIAEESTAWPGVTAPVAEGGLGFSRKWNLGWMHDTLGYFAEDPLHRSHQHGQLTFPSVYAGDEKWVLPLSHDEVVHGKGSLLTRQPGDRWQQFANLRALLGWQWCQPGSPLLFMGGEFGQVREWAEQRELDWWLLEDPLHSGVRSLVAAVNQMQAEIPALWVADDDPSVSFGWLDADDPQNSVFSFWRSTGGAPADSGGDFAVVVANLTPVPRHGYRVGVPWAGRWDLRLSTDAAEFGGSGCEVVDAGSASVDADGTTPWQSQPASLLITLPPLAVVVLTAAVEPG